MAEQPEFQLSELMGYNPVWFWVMLFIVLGIIFLTVFVFKRIKTVLKPKPINQPLMTGYAGEIDKAFVLVNTGQILYPEACQRVSIVLRDFIAQKTGMPARQMTLSDLQKAGAPPKLLESLSYAYPIMFGEREVVNMEEYLHFMNTSRAILDGWWE